VKSSDFFGHVDQLALFEAQPSPALLRSDLVNALLEHRHNDAARSLQCLLDVGHAEAAAFAAVLNEIEAIRRIQARVDAGQTDAACAVALTESIVQRLRPLVGEHCDTFACMLWSGLADQFAQLSFSNDDFKVHAGWMYLQARNARKALTAFDGIDAAKAPQEIVEGIVWATFVAEGFSFGWPPLCWHAWRWPEATRELIRQIEDIDINALERAFTRDCDLTMDWFPAWAMTQVPAMAVSLRRAVAGRESDLLSAAQQCAIAVYNLVIAEVGGAFVADKRRQLQAIEPWIYTQYMLTISQHKR
jgi:hypothetical protein